MAKNFIKEKVFKQILGANDFSVNERMTKKNIIKYRKINNRHKLILLTMILRKQRLFKSNTFTEDSISLTTSFQK
jgi:hypothetical protein